MECELTLLRAALRPPERQSHAVRRGRCGQTPNGMKLSLKSNPQRFRTSRTVAKIF
jgi:hypothetical protein